MSEWFIPDPPFQPRIFHRTILQHNRIEKAKRIKNKNRRERVIQRINQAINSTASEMNWKTYERLGEHYLALDKGEII